MVHQAPAPTQLTFTSTILPVCISYSPHMSNGGQAALLGALSWQVQYAAAGRGGGPCRATMVRVHTLPFPCFLQMSVWHCVTVE